MTENENIKEEYTDDEAVKPSSGKKEKIISFAAKVLAVVVAFFIWFYAVGTDSRLQERNVNGNLIDVVGVGSGFSVIYGNGETADVTVKGRYSDVINIDTDDIDVYVDAGAVTEAGQYTLPVSVKVDNGITLVSVYPEQITVYISANQKKQIPVKVKATDYQIPSGCTLHSEILGTNYITVEGPVDVLEKISYAQATVSPGVITDSVTIVSPVQMYTADDEVFTSPYVKASVSEITVKASVLKEKEIPLVVKTKYGYYNERNTEITLTPPSIIIRGDREAVDGIDQISVLVVDETAITADTVIKAAVTLPEGVENISGTEDVDVQIKHIGSTVKSIAVPKENVIFKNLPDNIECDVVTSTVKVYVRVNNDSEYLHTLNADNISVTVDLSSIQSFDGRYNVEADVKLNIPSNNGAYLLENYYLPVSFNEKTAD
ncbi:MAG: hypothetical protein IKL21_05935 [Clostridia bacterium]|nr:hypothetical protein [Clostridia bacterium]